MKNLSLALTLISARACMVGSDLRVRVSVPHSLTTVTASAGNPAIASTRLAGNHRTLVVSCRAPGYTEIALRGAASVAAFAVDVSPPSTPITATHSPPANFQPRPSW